MSDLVKRLRNWSDEGGQRGPLSHFKDIQLEAADEIERLVSCFSDSVKWVPVSERVPEVGQLIAIRYAPDSDVWDAYRWDAECETDDFYCWMPLPEPSK